MDLDDLKHIIGSKQYNSKDYSEDKIKSVVNRTSNHPAWKIRKKFVFELVFSVFFIVALLLIINNLPDDKIIHSSRMRLFNYTMISLLLITLVYGFVYYRRMTRIMHFGVNAKVFLKRFLKVIQLYLRFGKTLVFVLAPVGFVIGFVSTFEATHKLPDFIELFNHKGILVIMIVSFITAMVAAYYMTVLIQKLFYGKNIRELKKMIDDLEPSAHQDTH